MPKTQLMESAESASSSVLKPTPSPHVHARLGPGVDRGRHAEGVHYRWDAGTMQLRYAWTGEFLTPATISPATVMPSRVPGHIVCRNDTRPPDLKIVPFGLSLSKVDRPSVDDGRRSGRRAHSPRARRAVEQRAPWAVVWKSST